jgi:hypothetical protein
MDQTERMALAQLAQGQCGLFSAVQAARLGICHAQLSRASRQGHFRRVRSGIYAAGGVPASPWEVVVAAALAAGPWAVISHTGAAAFNRLEGVGVGSRVPELIVPRDRHPRLSRVVVHRCGPLSPQDVLVKCGVLVTSPARTLVDLAGRYKLNALARILDEGLIEHRFGIVEVRRCLERTATNTPGRSRIQQLLAARSEGPAADSILEARSLEALQPLAPFKVHFVVGIGGNVYVLDAAWPDRRVAAEIVGRSHRMASRSAFDRERRKLNALAGAGWRVAHLTSVMTAAEIVAAVRGLF